MIRPFTTVTRWLVSHWFGVAVAGSLFFAMLLLLPRSINDLPVFSWFFHLLLLNDENNVAVWWSGALLAVAAIHAFDGHALLRDSEPRAARGWAALAIILVILSADEIGSLHERAFVLLPVSYWAALLPPALVLLALLGYAVVALRSSETQKTRVLPILGGFACFGLVVVQEFLENRVSWTSSTRILRTFAEEGTELLGMLILFRVCLRNTRGLLTGSRRQDGPTLAIVNWRSKWLPILGIPAIVAVAYLTAAMPDQQRGHPADWLAAMLFLVAALAVAKPILHVGNGIGELRCALAHLLLVASVFAVTVRPHWVIELPGFDINIRLLTFFSIAVAVGALWFSNRAERAPIYAIVILAVLALLIGISSLGSNLFTLYLLTQALALLAYHVHSRQEWACSESRAL